MHQRILLLTFFLISFSARAQIENGTVDLRGRKLTQSQSVISLDGYWKFYPGKLVEEIGKIESQQIKVPANWAKSGFPNKGYGTYELLLITDESADLALWMADVYSSYNLFVNGVSFANIGHADSSRSLYRPYREDKTFSLERFAGQDTLLIQVEVANFHHSKGGIGDPVLLGPNTLLKRRKAREDLFDGFLGGCLAMGAFFFLGLFFFGKHEKISLFFALFCLAYAYRVLGWGNYVLHDVVYIPYEVSIRLEYMTFYLAGYFFALYIKNLFPEDTPSYLVRIFADLSLVWAGLTLLPVDWFTRINVVYLVAMLFGISIIVFIYVKASVHRRPGAKYSLFSTFGLFIVFSTKTLDYLDYLQEPVVLTSLGQMIFFFFQSLILSERFSESWRLAQKAAEESARSKAEFLSVMSHEIRTPLNAVIGTTYHLMDENPREDQMRELKNLKISSENLLALINNILDFSKIESEKIEFDEVDVNLRDYSERAINLFRLSAENKGLVLEFRYDSDLPEVVRLDKLRVNQVLANLLSNAIKFTDQGYVRLKVTNESQEKDKVDVRFTVEDTGIGIDEEKHETIFHAFEQAQTDTTRKYGGTGLGLSITRKLIEMMGAKLHLDSRLGSGAKFYFTMSLKLGDPNNIHRKVESTFDLKGLRILLVEDNEMNTVVATNILQKWNVDLDIAANGIEAVQKVIQEDFEFVLMDLQMPEMDGYEATRKIREMGYTMPVIALTASAMLDKSSKLKESGLDGAITKPFNPKDLYQAIAERL